jgi:hypothetical protein
MVTFLGSWAVAILLVLRWFHVVSTNREISDELFVEPMHSGPAIVHARLSSSLS